MTAYPLRTFTLDQSYDTKPIKRSILPAMVPPIIMATLSGYLVGKYCSCQKPRSKNIAHQKNCQILTGTMMPIARRWLIRNRSPLDRSSKFCWGDSESSWPDGKINGENWNMRVVLILLLFLLTIMKIIIIIIIKIDENCNFSMSSNIKLCQ